MATLSEKFFHELPGDRKCRRMMSRMEHATKKYCCTSLSSFPFSVLSFGYRTLETVSPMAFSRTASTYPPELNTARSKSSDAREAHRRRMFTVFVQNPATGMSCGTPSTVRKSTHFGVESPRSLKAFTTCP